MNKKIAEIEVYMVVTILVGVWRIYFFWIAEIMRESERMWDKPYDLIDKEEQRHCSLCSKDYNLRFKNYH